MTRQNEIYKTTIIGGIANALLVSIKFFAGIFGHSAAMFADAVHSLSDFITDILVLVFVKISNKPQDKGHDYGHGKYETIAATIIGLGLMIVATSIIYNAATRIANWINGEAIVAPDIIALWAALLSIVVKEILYRYTNKKAKQCNSSALHANAWHHRSDAFSSIGTAFGIGGAILLGNKWTILDPIASIVIGAIIIKMSVQMIKNGLAELTDSSLSDETEQEILNIISLDKAISEPHNLRTRRIGNKIAIEFHIRMNGDMSLRESHEHSKQLEAKLRDRFGSDTHIMIHIEPIDK